VLVLVHVPSGSGGGGFGSSQQYGYVPPNWQTGSPIGGKAITLDGSASPARIAVGEVGPSPQAAPSSRPAPIRKYFSLDLILNSQ
jgi:hypothetical protein